MTQLHQMPAGREAANSLLDDGGPRQWIADHPEIAALAGFFVALSALVFVLPVAPFSIDNMLYIEMARAMAEHGAFTIAQSGDVVDPGALTYSLTHNIDGQVTPQYPGGYALLAAPFYALMGVRGLVMINVIGACIVVALTYRMARELYTGETIARLAAGLLALASFLAVYAVGVWPHMATLALIMAGAERVVVAARARQTAPLLNLALAGLWLGLAINLRVDALFSAAAILVWLRLFAMPSRRIGALVLLAGAVPGLLLAAGINWVKFAEASPFTYGPKEGFDTASAYTPLLAAAGAVGFALLCVDVSSARVQRLIEAVRGYRWTLAIALALVALAALIAPLRQIAVNLYVLLFDLQQLDPNNWQPGVEIGEHGYVQFWGGYKKAFFQSLPYAVLMIAPLVAFVRGVEARASALLLGMAAAPVLFYSLNQWHGGYSYSMRYFLPALPGVMILAARGLSEVLGEDAAAWRGLRLAGCLVLAAGVALVAPVIGNPDHNSPLLHYAPTMAVMALLLAATSLWLARPGLHHVRTVIGGLAGAAIAIAICLNLYDLASVGHRKGFVSWINAVVDHALPADDALMLTTFNESMMAARADGLSVLDPNSQSAAEVQETIAAYRAAGRCVYLYLPEALDVVDPMRSQGWRLTPIAGVPTAISEFSALYQPPGQGAACDPQG